MSAVAGRVRRWTQRRSLTLLPVGTTCCAAELDAALGPTFDPAHHGIDVVQDPFIADVLVVAGRVTGHVAAQVKELYHCMPASSRVIAFGSCAISGGLWREAGTVVGLDTLIPVDVCVPGCAPPPQHLYAALAGLRCR